jgi:outer membrane protein OmpA-like peptidoglycan-associated protein
MKDEVRAIKSNSSSVLKWLSFICVMLFPMTGWTQQNTDNTAFQLQQFRPWGDPDGLFQTQTARTLGQWNFKLGIIFNYAKDQLILRPDQPVERIPILDHQLSVDVMAGLGLFSWLDLELMIPFAIYQTGQIPVDFAGDLSGRDLSGFAFSDIKIGLKVQALEEKKHWLSMGFRLYFGLPSGDEQRFQGEEGLSFGIDLMLSKRHKPIQIALNLGYRYLPRTVFSGLVISHELTYNLGIAVDAIPDRLVLVAELTGATALTENVSLEAAPLELMAGFRIYPINKLDLAIHLGVGVGLFPGYGSPQFRILAGLIWARRVYDRDGDGVPDDTDHCPDVPGPKENNGCPWGDRDGDGIADNIDKCPDEPGPQENHGCPWPDRDKDGIPDHLDKCPDKPGPKKFEGCPDSDGDGIPDHLDKCPTVPGPKEFEGCPDSDGDGIPDHLDKCPTIPGPKENHGCPWPDRDKDGVPDHLDKCPTVPGPKENHGCPVAEVKVVRGRAVIDITQKIHFEFNKHNIMKNSHYILNNVASILEKYPDMRIRIEGHTDRIGTHSYNIWLSRKRAQSVSQYLMLKGIERRRLISNGYGFTRPIATNRTPEGRAENRRVEFVILDKKHQKRVLDSQASPTYPHSEN